MSLGIAFKGPEGIVLAADSRVTLMAEMPDQKVVVPATFDNATKLLGFSRQKHVGVVTYGVGAIGQNEPRTAHSFLPEFENQLPPCKEDSEEGRLSVLEFASRLSSFFMEQWGKTMPKDYKGQSMVFFIGGYDKDYPYGRVFEVSIPSRTEPKEWHDNSFGIVWGGQRSLIERLIHGFDSDLPRKVQELLKLSDEDMAKLEENLKTTFGLRIPYQFLPLQDSIDLAISLIRTTIKMQTWLVGIRGVGGAIDVATITRAEGFKPVQQKSVRGEGPAFRL